MRIFSFNFIFILAHLLYSQENALTKALLATARYDGSVSIQQEKSDFLENSRHSFPLIRDVEFRVRNEAFEFDKQRYSLRVEPAGFGEARSAKKMNRLLTDHASGLNRLRLNEALLKRYMLILYYVESHIIKQLYEDLAVLYEDRIGVLEQKVYNSEIDLGELIKAEDDLTKMKSSIIEVKKEIGTMQRQIAAYLKNNKFVNFDTTDLIDINVISVIMDTTQIRFDTNNVYMKIYKSEFKLSENRYLMELAQSRRYIPFLEFSYDHGEMEDELARQESGRAFNTYKSYILELGLKVPFFNSDRQVISRRKIEFLSDKESYERLGRELHEKMQKDIDDIRALIDDYNHLRKRDQEVDAEASLKKYMQMSGVDPLIVLSIKESSLKNNIRMETVRFSTIRNFIRVMDVSGRLSEKPLKNFISAKQEIID